MQQRAHRHNGNAVGLRGKLIERGDTIGNDLLMRREVIVWQRFPIGENRHVGGVKLLYLALQLQRGLRVWNNENRVVGMGICQFGHRKGQ